MTANLRRVVTALAVTASAMIFASAQANPLAEWKPVETALGRTGQPQPGGVMKFSMPRTDLHVAIGDTKIQPGLALGSWAAFKRDGDKAMVMGDLVLIEQEIAPVMQHLQDGGIEITALHNHLLGEQPRILYMHISGHGDAAALARALHNALGATGTPAASPAPAASAAPELNTAELDRVLGRPGKMNGAVFQYAVPRAEKIVDHGIEVPPSMGLATSINFQAVGSGRAAATGDFVLIASEVNPVIKALRLGGVQVTAVHSHMLEEQPRLFFLHFWAAHDAAEIARTLRSALDKTNSAH